MLRIEPVRAMAVASAVLIGAGLSLVGSCQAPPRGAAVAAEPGLARSRTVSPGPEEPVQVPDLTPGPSPVPSPRAQDGLWRDARRGDPIDLERLANREGAAGLLEGLAEGRDVGLTALSALPHADDAELALGRLCQILRAAPSRVVLASVHGIVARLPEPVERLDPGGMRACRPVLEKLAAASSGRAAAERDLASSALLLIAEHAPR